MLSYLKKILTNKFLLSFARSLPAIVFFSTIILGLITSNRIFYVLFILFNVSEIVNKILKFIAERIMGRKYFKIIGYGIRPSDKLKTYGMPSGHAQLTASLCAFIAFYNKNNTNHSFITLNLLLFTLYIMFSRVYEKFHTVQQTIIGAMVGYGLAYYAYKIYLEFKQKNLSTIFSETSNISTVS